MKLLITIIFIALIIYNLKKRSQNEIQAKLPTSYAVVSLLLLAGGLCIWHLFDRSILGIVPVIAALLAFLSYLSSVGINDHFFNCLSANSILIQSIPCDDVKRIEIIKKNDEIELKIKAYGDVFWQQYDLKSEEELIHKLNRHLNTDKISRAE